MSLVVDASVALKWYLVEAESTAALALLQGSEPLLAPQLIVSEICNAAWKLWRRDEIDADQVSEIARSVGSRFAAPLFDMRSLAQRAGQLATELDHPAYDCFYLALAEREAAMVVTADRKLVRKLAGTPFSALARLLA